MNQKTQADSSAPIGCSPAVGPLVPHNPDGSPVDLLGDIRNQLDAIARECGEKAKNKGLELNWQYHYARSELAEASVLVGYALNRLKSTANGRG